MVLMRELLIGETRQEAFDRCSAGLLAQYRYYRQNGAFNPEHETWMAQVQEAHELTWELLARDRVIWGAPEECAEQLRHWCVALDCSHVQVTVPHRRAAHAVLHSTKTGSGKTGWTRAGQLAAIRLIGDRLLPALR